MLEIKLTIEAGESLKNLFSLLSVKAPEQKPVLEEVVLTKAPEPKKEAPKPVEAKPVEKPAEEKKEEAKPMTLSELRAELTKLAARYAAAGKEFDLSANLKLYGAASLSTLDPVNYSKVLEMSQKEADILLPVE